MLETDTITILIGDESLPDGLPVLVIGKVPDSDTGDVVLLLPQPLVS